MNEKYPDAWRTRSRLVLAYMWWQVPPGTMATRIDREFILIRSDGRYWATDGVWRRPEK